MATMVINIWRQISLSRLNVMPTAIAVKAGENPHNPLMMSTRSHPQMAAHVIPKADPTRANAAVFQFTESNPASIRRLPNRNNIPVSIDLCNIT